MPIIFVAVPLWTIHREIEYHSLKGRLKQMARRATKFQKEKRPLDKVTKFIFFYLRFPLFFRWGVVQFVVAVFRWVLHNKNRIWNKLFEVQWRTYHLFEENQILCASRFSHKLQLDFETRFQIYTGSFETSQTFDNFCPVWIWNEHSRWYFK